MIGTRNKTNCDHVVQFYDNDDHLVRVVTEYIATGFMNNEICLVVATSAHLTLLRHHLRVKLGDAADQMLSDTRQCLLLDADQVLSSIMVNGWPEESRVIETLGILLTTVSATGKKPIRAFGEMVTLLCERNQHDAAMHLDFLWNRLATKHTFSLLCAYPLSAFPKEEHAQAFHTICHLHSHVCPAEASLSGYSEDDPAIALAKLQQQAYVMRTAVNKGKETQEALNAHERLLVQNTAALLAANERLKQEIEKRKRSEKDLLHSQYVLTHAQSVAHLGSWEIDADTEEISCSDEFYRICGIEPQSMKFDLAYTMSIVHPDDKQAASDAVLATREHGLPYNIEKRIIRPDGSVRYVLSQGNPIFDEQHRLVTVVGSFLDITDQKLAEQALQKTHDDLRRLTAHQEKIKEQERQRIAREIHDELGGVLTGLKAYLMVSMQNAEEAGRPPDRLLMDAQQFTDNAIESVRRIISDLRPSVLDQLGVWAALEWYADRIAVQTGLSCQCMITRAAVAIALDAERSTMLFRIVQEALTNVIRHAEATAVRIAIGVQDNQIIVEVEDDGRGFDSHTLPKQDSWGIQGMYERVSYFGGELVITGTPGQGTILLLKLPLEVQHAL